MEITGFTRTILKHGKPDISEQVSKASRLFGKIEYQTVLQGQRKATTDHLYLDNLKEKIDKFNRDGLVFTPCQRSGFYQGFAHKHKEVKPGEPYYWFGAVTRTVEDGLIFKEAEAKNDSQTIGGLLGYPECCTKYFSKTFSGNYDPVWCGHSDVVGEPEINILLRYFGIRIVSHLPCSPYCEGTLKIARERVDIANKIDPETTEWVLEYLSSPMTWNSYHGVVEVDTPDFLGLTHTYPFMDKPRIIIWNKHSIG